MLPISCFPHTARLPARHPQVWKFESDSTLGDACDGQLGRFPVRDRAFWCS